jgi:hypothetical protein
VGDTFYIITSGEVVVTRGDKKKAIYCSTCDDELIAFDREERMVCYYD